MFKFLSCFLCVASMTVGIQAFVAPSAPKGWTSTTQIASSRAQRDDEFVRSLQEIGDSQIPYVFTGGMLDKMESQAARVASRITSVKDLGWTSPAKRRGAARPRHRAYGGQTEKPVQLKPNYDESHPLCVEKWLTQEEFYKMVGDSSPAADTVFVALAGGAAFAERSVAEEKLNQWRSGGGFNEAAFLKSVQQGRVELGLGWAVFLSLNAFFVGCIVAPTNPLALVLYDIVGQLRTV